MKRILFPVFLIPIFYFLISCSNPSSESIQISTSADFISMNNGLIELQFDKQQNAFDVKNLASDLTFIAGAELPGKIQSSEISDWSNSTWPVSKTLQLTNDSETTFGFVLIPDFPFLLLETTLHNQASKTDTVRRYFPPEFPLTLKAETSQLRAFGTFGLDSLDNNPGSYSFMSIVEPASRNGLVAGWLTHERGSGILFSSLKNGRATLIPRIDYGKLLVRPDQKSKLETLLFGYFPDARLGLEAYAAAIQKNMNITLPEQPVYYCTWHHARASNETDIVKNATFVKKNLSRFGFTAMQIDDRWQEGDTGNGPGKNFTTHLADGPYPSGMKKTAEAISSLGLTPGIWFMPFTGTWDDPFFADKKEIFVRTDGQPFRTYWGGDCFDLTHPKTLDYVRSVVRRIARDWGYTYFKMDGLWTGMATRHIYINTGYRDDELGAVTLFNPDKTQLEAYRDGLKAVREAAGNSVYLSGCNAAQNMRTLGASFGLLDAMRVGADNGPNWDRLLRGAFSGSNLYFLHGRVWHNDPDPVHVRPSLPLNEAQAIVSFVALTGQLHGSSEDYANLPPERLDLLKRSMPAHHATARPVDLFERNIPRIWLVTDSSSGVPRRVIGLFNWEENEPIDIRCSLKKLGLSDTTEYAAFDFWAEKFLPPIKGDIIAHLPARTCRVLSLRPINEAPAILSTSRHVNQGMVDIISETWDAPSRTLHAVSRIVGDDPCEIRILAGNSTNGRTVEQCGLSEADQNTCVTIKLISQNGNKVRVLITSPITREVGWWMRFR